VYGGFINEVGTLLERVDDHIWVSAPKSCGGLELGSSVNVAGVCVSVTALDEGTFRAAISEETIRRSTLGELLAGSSVNVELPLRAGDPLQGHLVQGHVDAVGKVVRIAEEGASHRIWIKPPDRVLRDVVAKGSIAVDGVSLTVAEIVRDRFSVALIPATLDSTTLSELVVGSRVNLETDLVGKLARRYAGEMDSALATAIGSLPWAGILTGRRGVEKAVNQVAAGGAVVVWDPTREGEGDAVAAGVDLRPETFVFFLTRACGHTTVPCDRQRLDRLEIPPMAGRGDRQGTAHHLSVDLASSTGTGVSAPERAATIRRLAHADARPEDFLRPGHVFPLGARDGGLHERAGHTEAAVALCSAAGLPTVAAICEVMSSDGTMAGFFELERFALRWGLPMVDIGDLVAWL
jgi:3,4-dihydroxy 2-butanone 4-phosphate synthase/3,4-dihydroxy 2-butanone 4-phosphate synthase/GTP cyclohydrolase II